MYSKPYNVMTFEQLSEAMRLVMKSEALVKILNPDFSLVDIDEAKFNSNWDFEFKKLLNLDFRPDRRICPKPEDGSDEAFSALQGKKVPVTELEVSSKSHTPMTSTTLVKPDGRMNLFGTDGEGSIAIGLIFDIRLCDLVGENFVFEEDALTFNDWWNSPLAETYKNRFQGQTVNSLRDKQGFSSTDTEVIPYNELLAGLSLNALKGIIIQVRNTSIDQERYKLAVLNAIYRKVYIHKVCREKGGCKKFTDHCL